MRAREEYKLSHCDRMRSAHLESSARIGRDFRARADRIYGRARSGRPCIITGKASRRVSISSVIFDAGLRFLAVYGMRRRLKMAVVLYFIR